MAAAGVWWGVLMVPVANQLDELLSAEDQRVAAAVVFHGLGAAAVIAASLAAFRWRFRGTPNLRRGAMWLGGGLLFGGIFALGFTVTYARSTSYSNEVSVVVTELVIATGCCTAGAIAGAWAWRISEELRPRRQ